MPPHYLHHKGALVAGGGIIDSVESFGYAVQGRIGTDSHIYAEHIVVYRANQPYNSQIGVPLGNKLRYLTTYDQLGQQFRPFAPEKIGPGQAAVAADNYQPVDAPF